VVNRYRFDDVQIDLQSFRLFKTGKAVPVEPKALNLLVFLVENRGRLIERRELIDAVWGDSFVTDHVLNYAIGQLRKGLADDAKKPRYIETVPTLGYRFIANVEVETPEGTSDATIPSKLQHVPQQATPGQQGLSESATPIAGESSSGPPRRLKPYAAVILGFAFLVVVSGVAFWIESRAGHASSTVPIRSLAVLPLENLSGDPSQEYLADGMTDELITGLGQIGALRVISRITAMQYKNTRKPLPQIARELNVDAVIEGSVVRLGDKVRIAAQLIEAPADKQLWAHSYEGDMRDILGLQNQVASSVAEQIRLNLTSKEQTHLADTRQVNPQAYEAFLKGYFFDQNSPEAEQKSLQYFRQASELDPKFARAYVGIARSYNFLAGWGVVPTGEATAAADAAVAKALELDPELGEAYSERAWTLMLYHWDFPGAERDFRHALELEPGTSSIHEGYAIYSVTIGRFDEGVQEIKRARDLDPLSLIVNTDYCVVLRFARQYKNAIAQCKATLELDPRYQYALFRMGELYEDVGEYSEAHKIWARLGGFHASHMEMLDEIHGAPGVAGSFDAWIKTHKEPLDAFFISSAYAGLGRKDQAFAWLQKAYEQRSSLNLMTFLAVDPEFDHLRSDPRFDAFLNRIGLPPQLHIGSTQTKPGVSFMPPRLSHGSNQQPNGWRYVINPNDPGRNSSYVPSQVSIPSEPSPRMEAKWKKNGRKKLGTGLRPS
jgi:TolB-like protein/DNA-binding winged helix-turn-helix (wHTH) protein